MSTSHPTCRGFTLLELVIAVGMTALLVGSAMTLLISQQAAHQAGATERGLQEAGQTALLAIGERLRSAGYGMDPAYALDFGDVDRVPQQGLRAGAKLTHFKSHLCAGNPVRCRDQSHGPVAATGSDEIVFYARNPMFSRTVMAASAGVLTVRGDLKKPLHAGQVLQVMCIGGDKLRAYVTVAGEVEAAAVPDDDAAVDIPLVPAILTNGLPTFPLQNGQLEDELGVREPCYSSGTAVVAMIDRYRYYVDWYFDNGTRADPQTPGARPFLMLDQGLTDADNNAIVTPVAENVEDLQLTYFFPRAGAGQPPRLSGTVPGTNIADDDPAVRVDIPPPAIDDPLDAASRSTGSPANILAVRVSVVVRTAERDVRWTADSDRELPQVGNRAAFLGLPEYRRAVFEETFLLPNLATGTIVYCAIGTGAGYNLGGC